MDDSMMDQGIRLTLNSNITLRHFSALATAISLWETPNIKNEIKNFGEEIRPKDVAAAYNERDTWCGICEKVSNKLKDLDLPAELISELEKIIPLVGDKIFVWTVFVVKELLFDVRYAQKIIWTPSGLIDENKIYQDFWRTNTGFGGIPHNYNKIALYSIACINADEKFLHKNLKDIATVLPPYTKVKITDLSKFKVNSAMTTLLIQYFVAKSRTLDFKSLYSTLKSAEYPNGADIIFYYCAIYGLDKAAEYFYKKLKLEDQAKFVLAAAVDCVRNAPIVTNFNYEKGRIPQVLLYLLNKMPREIKKKFLCREIVGVFTIFYFTWPYQNLCIPIFDYVSEDLPSDSQTLLCQTAFDVLKLFSSRHTVYRVILKPVLMYIMLRISDPDKSSFEESFKEFLDV